MQNIHIIFGIFGPITDELLYFYTFLFFFQYGFTNLFNVILLLFSFIIIFYTLNFYTMVACNTQN